MKKKKTSVKSRQHESVDRQSSVMQWFSLQCRSVLMSWIFREAVGIFLIACSVLLTIGFVTFKNTGTGVASNCGKTITESISFLFHRLGLVSLLVPVVLAFQGVVFFRYRKIEKKLLRFSGFMAFLVVSTAFFSHIFQHNLDWHGYSFSAGGTFGFFLVRPLLRYLDTTGTTVLLITLVLITFLGLTGLSYNRLLADFFYWLKVIFSGFLKLSGKNIRMLMIRYRARKTIRAERKVIKHQETMQRLLAEQVELSSLTVREKKPVVADVNDDDDESFFSTPLIIRPAPAEIPAPAKILAPAKIPALELDFEDPDSLYAVPITIKPDEKPQTPSTSSFTRSVAYEYPDFNLLDDPPASIESETHAELLKKSEMLLSKLKEFSIEGRITEVCPGPVITRYEFEPAPGIKISRVIGLSDDLALGMRSRFGLRVSPIPGKSTLGVEIPNQQRETVYLKEILSSEDFQKAQKKSILSLPLGKDTAGRPFISDLKRMPHLLIAGATGSGKSVCINTILAGLLFVANPSELRLLLIDPKMLELSDFNGIPHLREPVITDAKQTPDALNWAVSEMERRYRLLAGHGVRNIDQFNAKVMDPKYDGQSKSLPYLVVVIDELADLMLTAAATIEDTIQRLAQMARAAGIHLIIATQRPSVDVITGVIKANLPCRLAFQVASKVDSRTILDTSGAEKLIGMGDCIFIPPGTSQLIRAHGAFVSESEIKRLVSHLSQQPVPDDEELSIFHSTVCPGDELDGVDDPMFDDAVKLVLSSGVASISMIQRRLKVGHSRASRLIDFMELSGIVGPHIGSKTREILVDPDEYLERMNEIRETDVYEP